MASKFEYRVNPAKAKKGKAVTFINKEAVNLAGDGFEEKIPGGPHGPERIKKVRKGTQKDLEWFYEQSLVNGHPTQTLVTKHDKSITADNDKSST